MLIKTTAPERLILLTASLCVLCVCASTAGADVYTEKTADVARLEKAGRLKRAADVQEALARSFPQDYAVVLRSAWLAYRAGRYARAGKAYRAALALSPQSLDARLGLAWTLAKEGDREQAHELFMTLKKEAAENPSVSAGLKETAAAPPSMVLAPLAGFGVLAYDGHQLKKWALATTVGLSLRAARFQLTAAYRYSYFATVGSAHSQSSALISSQSGALGPGPGVPPPPPPPGSVPSGNGSGAGLGNGAGSGFSHHEAYLTSRYDVERFGIGAQYAYIYDGSGEYGHVHLGGLSLRYSPWGDIMLSGNVSAYQDATIWRGVLAWRLPLGIFGVTPGVALQGNGEQARVAGELAVDLRWRWFSLYVGGRYGDQERLAYLERLVVYDVPETITYGGWAGLGLQLGRLGVGLTYSIDRYESSAGQRSNGHFAGLTLSFSSNRF